MTSALFEAPIVTSPSDEPLHVGHALLVPTRFRADAQLDGADRFGTGPHGHEGIETAALASVFGRGSPILRHIYFGNWSRDLSQAIPPVFFDKLGATHGTRLANLVFDVLDILAEATFGRRLNRLRFGTYRWEEHIDNPRGFGVALHPTPDGFVQQAVRDEDAPEATRLGLTFWSEDPRLGLPRYVMASRAYALRQLINAIQAGNTPIGHEHLGNALHVIEDFFAHSNFVELALNLLGRENDPGTGWLSADPGRAPIKDSKRRWRLTTGVFFLEDTAISLEKLLVQRLETHDPGKRSDTDKKIMVVLIRRTLGETLAAGYLRIANAWGSALGTLGVRMLQETFDRTIKQPVRLALAAMLRPLTAESVRASQRRDFSTPLADGRVANVRERAHSSIAKDDHHARYHQQAKALAGASVTAFAQVVNARWASGNRQVGLDVTARLNALMDQYVNHPQAVTWWRPFLGAPVVPSAPPRPAPAPRPAHPPSPAPRPAQRSLRRGSRGRDVADLQSRLNAWMSRRGLRPQLVVDGRFGPRTDAAVRAFQRAAQLAPDGVVGPRTREALGRAR